MYFFLSIKIVLMANFLQWADIHALPLSHGRYEAWPGSGDSALSQNYFS